MITFMVEYIVYEKNNSFVLAEGTMPVNCNMSNQAENVVRSMFPNGDVIIRQVRQS
jgi:hypothetical protein